MWLHLLLPHSSLVIIKGASNLGLTLGSNSLLTHRLIKRLKLFLPELCADILFQVYPSERPVLLLWAPEVLQLVFLFTDFEQHEIPPLPRFLQEKHDQNKKMHHTS